MAMFNSYVTNYQRVSPSRFLEPISTLQTICAKVEFSETDISAMGRGKQGDRGDDGGNPGQRSAEDPRVLRLQGPGR